MEFRYHPLIEGLRINEDGTEIILNGKPLKIGSFQLKTTIKPTRQLKVYNKSVTVIKLVCESWHGMSPNSDSVARRIDEKKGDHYTNLFWGKRGTPENMRKGCPNHPNKKMSIEVYEDIINQAKKSSIVAVLKKVNISERTFYRFQKKYVKKENR
jgi:hypothetical protein